MQAAGLEAAPELTRGAVFLVPAGTALQLQSEAADGPMLVSGSWKWLRVPSAYLKVGFQGGICSRVGIQSADCPAIMARMTPGPLLQLWSCAINRRVFAEPAPAEQPGKQEAGRLREKQLDLVGAA